MGKVCVKDLNCLKSRPSRYRLLLRLSENAHLPFDRLTALSKVEGLRYPHPSSLRRTSMYASFLGISSRSKACGMDIFHQPLRSRFFDNLVSMGGDQMQE
jgi:hypothetical protein